MKINFILSGIVIITGTVLSGLCLIHSARSQLSPCLTECIFSA